MWLTVVVNYRAGERCSSNKSGYATPEVMVYERGSQDGLKNSLHTRIIFTHLFARAAVHGVQEV